MNEKLCIECKKKVVWFYRSYFCKDCIKNFFEEDKNGSKKVV